MCLGQRERSEGVELGPACGRGDRGATRKCEQVGSLKDLSSFEWEVEAALSQLESRDSRVSGGAMTVNHQLVLPTLFLTLFATMISSVKCSLRIPAIAARMVGINVVYRVPQTRRKLSLNGLGLPLPSLVVARLCDVAPVCVEGGVFAVALLLGSVLSLALCRLVLCLRVRGPA